MPTDVSQAEIAVGNIVNVPCRITAIGGTTTAPTVTLETVYKGFNGAVDTVGPIDPIQVKLATGAVTP
jgi:hypothetical protein